VTAEEAAAKADEPSFRVPPATFIGGVLIRDWVEGKIGFQPQAHEEVFKGNL
jgi:NAD+ diphosphatase